MNSGKAHFPRKLFFGEPEGVHAVVGEALEECGARESREARGGTGREAADFVEFHCRCEEQFGTDLPGGGTQGEQAFIGDFKGDLAHAREASTGTEGKPSCGARKLFLGSPARG